MLTRDFRRSKERIRNSLKPLFSHFFLPAPSAFAGLDIRLRRAALYPAELRVFDFFPLLTRTSGPIEGRYEHSPKPLFRNSFLIPPFTVTRLDIRLRHAECLVGNLYAANTSRT